MTCEECRALQDEQEAPLELESASRVRKHLAECAACREEQARLEALIDRFKAGLRPGVRPALLDRLNARIDGELEREPAGTGESTERAFQGASRALPSPPAGRSAAFSPAGGGGLGKERQTLGQRFRIPAALLLATSLMLLLVGRDGVRLKGEASSAAPLALDLQVSVERVDGTGHARLERAEDGASLGPRDGLIFRFGVEGGAQLLLLERDPQHRFKVVFERGDLARVPGYTTIDITNAAGRTLRYMPDGAPGEYTLLAVLNRVPQSTDPAMLDAYWARYADRVLDQATPIGSSDLRLEALRFEVLPAVPAQGDSSDIRDGARP